MSKHPQFQSGQRVTSNIYGYPRTGTVVRVDKVTVSVLWDGENRRHWCPVDKAKEIYLPLEEQ